MKTEGPSFSKTLQAYERTLLQPEADHTAATIEVVQTLRRDFPQSGLIQLGNTPAVAEHLFTRLAAAITSWAVSPATVLNLSSLRLLCRYKQDFVYIFHASGYRNMAHLAGLMGEVSDDGQVTLSSAKAVVLLALLGLDDMTDELLALALKTEPKVFLHLLLGWLNQRSVLTNSGENVRGRLLQSGGVIKDVEILEGDVGLVVNAYMYASYASEPNKHQIKKTFNQLLLGLMRRSGIEPKMKNRPPRNKPLIVVIHERFMEGHAMYRSYAPLIKRLAEKFELFAIAEGDKIDDRAVQLFDGSHILPKGETVKIKVVSELIRNLRPDIVYYPSLGMSHWTVMLSNLRLAPLQIMTFGHPATSMSPEIDFGFIGGLQNPENLPCSERLLHGRSAVSFELHQDLPAPLPDLLPPSPRLVRVAVNSKVMKLSHRLFDLCKRIERESETPVKFYFFPGEMGWWHDGIRAAIKAHLPDAEVVAYKGYADFVRQLAACDLALAAFPFGNTNSTVDTSLLGLPTVVHFGPEPPAQSDAMVLRTAGLADWLICHDDETYFATAMRLINDAEARVAALNGRSREEIRLKLTKPTEDDHEGDMAALLWHVLQNQRAIVAEGVREISFDEI